MDNPFSLESKTILVVGGSLGIGRATAVQCSRQGARVIVIGRNKKRLQETMTNMQGEGHSIYSVDITDENAVMEFLPQLSSLDGLVLCAGVGAMKPFAFGTREEYDRVFNLNFFATVEFLRLLVKKKKLNKGSSVVIVSSIGGVFDHTPGNSIYGASKAAINSTMKYCAVELAPKKVRVNSVCPGMVNTPFNSPDILTEEQLNRDIEKYPLKRIGEPEDIAYGIIYLLSEASSWVTGHSLVIDGGITLR